jgi:hypothetical protein
MPTPDAAPKPPAAVNGPTVALVIDVLGGVTAPVRGPRRAEAQALEALWVDSCDGTDTDESVRRRAVSLARGRPGFSATDVPDLPLDRFARDEVTTALRQVLDFTGDAYAATTRAEYAGEVLADYVRTMRTGRPALGALAESRYALRNELGLPPVSPEELLILIVTASEAVAAPAPRPRVTAPTVSMEGRVVDALYGLMTDVKRRPDGDGPDRDAALAAARRLLEDHTLAFREPRARMRPHTRAISSIWAHLPSGPRPVVLQPMPATAEDLQLLTVVVHALSSGPLPRADKSSLAGAARVLIRSLSEGSLPAASALEPRREIVQVHRQWAAAAYAGGPVPRPPGGPGGRRPVAGGAGRAPVADAHDRRGQ